MTGDAGKQILRDNGLQPIETPKVNAAGQSSVPSNVMSSAEAVENLGPLSMQPQGDG
jgi:molybdate/tungstate transport system substrate-binding protein